MCAYSLITNATPTDILRHFHKVRLSAITNSLAGGPNSNNPAVNPVKHLISTLRVSQAIFPKRLSDALGRLKDVPLLQNKDVVLLEELDLKVHEAWIAEELLNYTPLPRHDELREPEAKKQVRSWAKQALQALIDGLRKNLERTDNFETVIRLREGVFQILPWSGKDLPGLFVPDVIDEFRTIFNSRLGEILSVRAQRLEKLVTTMSESFEKLGTEPLSTRSLWDDEIASMDTSNGASKLKTTIRSYYQGGDTISVAFIEEYDSWSDEMASLASKIKALREDRWDDDDLGGDIDDAESDSRRILLGSDDPKALEETFTTHIQASLQALRSSLNNLISQVSSTPTDSAHPPPSLASITATLPKAIITIRVLRSILSRPPPLSLILPPLSLPTSALTPLHTHLATHITTTPLSIYTTTLRANSSITQPSPVFSAPLLWEGGSSGSGGGSGPALPVQPAPSAYRLLREVVKGMDECGADVWGRGAVRAVQRRLKREIAAAVVENWVVDLLGETDEKGGNDEKTDAEKVVAATEDEDEGDGGGKTDDKEEDDDDDKDRELLLLRRKQKATQLLFDILYLSKALEYTTTADDDKDSMKSATDKLAKVAELDSTLISRMEKSAGDYWRRTYLMFALLAN
jgi:hypothetical protein